MDTLDALKTANDSKETTAPSLALTTVNGVPIEFINYFDVDIRKMDGRANTQLREIFGHLSSNSKSMGDVLSQIRKLDVKLGQPSFGESRYGRIWNYLKTSAKINDLEKQRKAI